MREIKFRAWIGQEMEYSVGVSPEGAFYCGGVDPKDTACLRTTLYCQNTPVMQFTNLKDKNGKEIYEGDIVKHYDGQILQVIWNNERWGYWTLMQLDKANEWRWYHEASDIEIIGNIYENPELLKGDQ